MTLVKRNGRSTAMPVVWDIFFDRDLFNWNNNLKNYGSSTPAVNIKETPDNFSPRFL